MFFLLQIVSLFWLTSQIETSAKSACREPKNLKDELDHLYRELLLLKINGSETFSIVPKYHIPRNTYPLSTNTKRQRIYGKLVCGKHRHMRKFLNFRSTCPWYMYLEYDIDRIPQAMVKAECTCKDCLNRDNSGKCEKVDSFVSVIRRTCIDGIYKYYIYMEPVPVGCTCKHHVKNSA